MYDTYTYTHIYDIHTYMYYICRHIDIYTHTDPDANGRGAERAGILIHIHAHILHVQTYRYTHTHTNSDANGRGAERAGILLQDDRRAVQGHV